MGGGDSVAGGHCLGVSVQTISSWGTEKHEGQFFFESVFGEFRGPISSNILYLAMFPVLLQDFF